MQGKLLASDMSAFKAANPGAGLLDFVRWHSPKDWLKDNSQPKGHRLSDRIVSLSVWKTAQSEADSDQRYGGFECNQMHYP